MKFLVLWRVDLSLLSAEMAKAVFKVPAYARPLEAEGKIVARYHIVGYHGGAWIYDVSSHEELELLLGRSPVYNFSTFEVLPLAEMADAEAEA